MMNAKSTMTFAAVLAASAVSASPALPQISIAEAPAVYRGPYTCAAKYPGSFWDLLSAACWQCPTTHPHRTIFIPITVWNACEKPAQTLYRKAYGPENATGLIGTDCRSGWFLHWDRKCYSCGSGYVRTADPNIASGGACVRVIPPAWTTATRRGVEGCPAGAFRNGLTANCYSCPPDYSRNAVIADDLTKVNACTKISVGVHDATRAKFLAVQDSYTETRDVLGRTASSLTTYNPELAAFDLAVRSLMKAFVDGDFLYRAGFDAVSWMVTGGGAAVLGYTHGQGYVMTKVAGAYQCRKTWSNMFTAGFSAGLGAVMELGFSKGVTAQPSQSNGWQISAAYPPVSGGWGLHWDAATGSLSSAYSFGPGFAAEANLSEYAHTWAETGKLVSCDKMTWGPGWFTL